MSKINVAVKSDFIQSLASVRPLGALSELIWNGFDAENSSEVRVNLDMNGLSGLESIRVYDNGSGIPHSQTNQLFGNLGDSWKRKQGRLNGRSLHGKNGQGRFKAFALGTIVEWYTTYEDGGKFFTYKITGNYNLPETFDVSDPVECAHSKTGTEVTVYNPHRNFVSLTNDKAPQELAQIFAAYLTEYPKLVLNYDGSAIDPKSVQKDRSIYPLGKIKLSTGKETDVELVIVEWNAPTDRSIKLCDSDGIGRHEVDAGIQAKGFDFTAYVKTDYFRELDTENKLVLEELHPDVDAILKVARAKLKEHFRLKVLEGKSQIVERWKAENIYPYKEKPDAGPIETAERQVFDILAVNVNDYLPDFEKLDEKAKRFTFRMLAQAVKENPESIQRIITEVLDLKKEQQDDLAELLKKTPLTAIINSAKTVANRLDFLAGLEELLFPKENKKALLERDQLHQVLNKEAWLFDENFALAGTEQRLEDVLHKHRHLLGNQEDLEPVILPNGATGRVDLFFSKVIQPREGEYDYLIIELKRPSQKINADVITQVKQYAMAVANDERFHGVPTRWKFIAISNELDAFAQGEADQQNRPHGLIHAPSGKNITVWVYPWAEIINNARTRLEFYRKQLEYDSDIDSAKSYLKTAHEKYIPLDDNATGIKLVPKPAEAPPKRKGRKK